MSERKRERERERERAGERDSGIASGRERECGIEREERVGERG